MRERDKKGDIEGEEEGDGSLAGVDQEEVVAGCLRLNLAATRGLVRLEKSRGDFWPWRDLEVGDSAAAVAGTNPLDFRVGLIG